jgi:hypothetical protein
MSKTFFFGAVALPLILGLFSTSVLAQGTVPPDKPQSPAPESAPPATPLPPGVSSTTTVVPSPPPPPKEPYVLEDGGFYIQPDYWISTAQPRLRGGLTATNVADFKYGGHAKAALGVEIGIPAGRSNTLRISAFRVQGNSGQTLGSDTLVFGEQYLAGDFINATYKLQAVKVSWDYLSYTWHKPKTAIRLKTLYEVQYVTTSFDLAAPYVPASTDASGNTDQNMANGSKSIVLPTFGMAIGSELGKRFRWDVRGSGFGLPKRGSIADVQAMVAFRISRVEIVAGERLFYFKTSPRTDMYTNDTLQGVFGGLRFAWRGIL